MKTRLLLTILGAFAAGAVALSGTAVAQGNGGGGGKGGGGGTPAPPDYGDLIILYRDAIGIPILDENSCQQPIAFPENLACDIDCGGADPCLIPVNENCGIENPNDAACTREADFGRTNLSRANDDVLDSQLEDVLVNLSIADCTSLDPAGRMVYSRYVDGQLVTGTIDSPLQNLSIYKHLIRDGTIGVPLPEGATAEEQAARGFGVAMDKAGEVNIDLLVYLNEILGLTEGATIFGDFPECINVWEEVMGTMQWVEKCFLNYGLYTYDRGTNFGALPSPAYIPEDDPTTPQVETPIDGYFEFLWNIDPNNNIFAILEDSIMTTVFQSDPGYTGGKIRGFAQAADDTREVINFMHSHPVADNVATPVPCMPPADPDVLFDLSISQRSGLKVPKQIVATTEGREFVVTVDNAGPFEAAFTLTVSATPANGPPVLVDGEEGPFVFTYGEVVDEFCTIRNGLQSTLSWSTGPVIFTIGTLDDDHEATTIEWEAVVTPVDCASDPVDNNDVTKYSNVRVSKGGGGGH